MPKYTVEVTIEGRAFYAVEANSREEAREAAVGIQPTELEWDWNTQGYRGGSIYITEETDS